MRPSATATTQATACASNRSTAGISKFNFNIAGQKYPMRDVEYNGTGSQVYSEIEIANKSLIIFSDENSINESNATSGNFVINNANGQSDANLGKFFLAVDLESQMSKLDDDGIYSGISTTGVLTQFEATFGDANAHIVDFYANYTMLLQLDTNTTNSWVVSV